MNEMEDRQQLLLGPFVIQTTPMTHWFASNLVANWNEGGGGGGDGEGENLRPILRLLGCQLLI